MEGFLGTNAPFLVDLFLVTQVAVLLAMYVAVGLARRKRVKAHVTVMVTGFVLFLVTVIAFEAQVHLGEPGPSPPIFPLAVHLSFALPGLGLWAVQIARGRRAHRELQRHRARGRTVVALLTLTVATGIWLYRATFLG